MIARYRKLRSAGVTLAVVACLGVDAEVAGAQVMATPPAIRDVTRRIDLVSPLSGPAGTEVRVRAEGFRPNTRVHIGIGELQGCGYQICEPAQIDPSGAIETTVVVPTGVTTTTMRW
jgi:hypothetical protein